jgi:hypothetical protein
MKYAQQKNNEFSLNKLNNKKTTHSRLQQNTPTNFYHDNKYNNSINKKYNQDLNYFYSQSADYHDLNEDRRGINYVSSDLEQIGFKKHEYLKQRQLQQQNYQELDELDNDISNQYEHDNEKDYDNDDEEQIEIDDENNYYMMMIKKKNLYNNNKKKLNENEQKRMVYQEKLHKNYNTKYYDNSYLRACNTSEYDDIDIDKLDDYNDISLNIIEPSRAGSKRLINENNLNLNSNCNQTPSKYANVNELSVVSNRKPSLNQSSNIAKISNANAIREKCAKNSVDQLSSSKKPKDIRLKSKNVNNNARIFYL